MKKIIGIFIFMLFITPISIASIEDIENEIFRTETISFSDPIFSEKGDYINVDTVESTSSLTGNDNPELPVVSKTFTFPFNTLITDVEVSFSNIKKELVKKPIVPAPEPKMLSSLYDSKDINLIEDTVAYNDLDVYPEKRYSYRVGAGLKEGERVKFLTVYLHPVQYIPKDNMICYSDSATININYLTSENPVIFPDFYDLLILTPAEFTDELQTLVDYKNENEIPTIMVTLDEIPEKGVDRQEDIKYYIKEAIETWGITYVLLVGSGVEGEEKFPVRYVYCSPYPYLEENFASDLYYADIYNSLGDFSTWDTDGDSRHVEYPMDVAAIDVYPDVYLGRLPCNNANEVNSIVSKIINYMEHNTMTNKILQIGGDSFPRDSFGVYEGEKMNQEVLKKLPDYSAIQLWGSLGNLKKLNIRKGFMDGVDFVDICTHGYSNSIATHPPNDLNTWIPPRSLLSPFPGLLAFDYDLLLFNNEKLPVIMYAACLCGRYTDTPSCMAWKPVSRSKGGGIASFGATSTIDAGVGDSSTERWMGWYEAKIFEEMYNNKILGLCLGNSITEYSNSFNLDVHDFTILLAFTLFGDPSLSIEDGKDTKGKMVLESNIWNDNFDSYNTGQFLDGTADDGGWQGWFNNSESGTYVVDDYARSTPNSVIVNGAVDLVHDFSKIRSGNLTFRDWVYIPSGVDHGESTIVLLGYYNSDQYYPYEGVYAQVAISFDANNKIVTCDGTIEHLPIIFNDWIEIRVEIDLESDWFECYYNDELLTGQKWSTGWGDHDDGFLNFAGVDLWVSYGEEYCVYHDDMSIHHTDSGLEPDLQCEGSLSFNCKSGETVTDTFTVRNIGDPSSRLEWIIYDAPEYSSDSFWLFHPFRGALTPEDGELAVTASLTAPDDVGDYSGVIKIHAIGDHSDSCEIPITLTVKKSRELCSQVQIWLEKHPHLFPIFHRFIGL